MGSKPAVEREVELKKGWQRQSGFGRMVESEEKKKSGETAEREC